MSSLINKITGFVIFGTWLAFFWVPFAGLPGTRDGIFVASPEWNSWAPWAIAQGTLAGTVALAAAVLVTWLCALAIARGKPDLGPLARRALTGVIVPLLAVLPFWGWGFERSFLRVWAHESAPTLNVATIEAVVNSYYVSPGRRGREIPRLNLRVPPYGRLQVQHHALFREGFEPQKGMTLQLSGRRTWVGTYYDTVHWPTDWLAAPKS